jgi:hypothetical protein
MIFFSIGHEGYEKSQILGAALKGAKLPQWENGF